MVSLWKKKLVGRQKREELEREVSILRKLLEHQQKVHEIMERVHHKHDLSALFISNHLPPKVKELLAELAMVEDEISRMETQISRLQSELNHEKEVTKEHHKIKQLQQQQQQNAMSPNNTRGGFSSFSPNFSPNNKVESGRMPFETKALHFISKAIKGDYSLNYENFSSFNERLLLSNNHKERSLNDEVGFQDHKALRKSGTLKPSSPMREPRHPTPKREHNMDVTNPIQTEEESIQKWSPNKLSENIMKCLIFIFVRLLRTSKAMELEKSGPISRSANFSLSSRSFWVDTISNSNASLLQKESRQQDPYVIFTTDESISRDIGPYKNLVIFTSRNLDPKCISNSSSIPLVQRLRVLMNSLQKVDLRHLSYQRKLAFWVNMYNACIMHVYIDDLTKLFFILFFYFLAFFFFKSLMCVTHTFYFQGFLQYGVPSSPEKLLTLMNKATLNIGGNTINAHAIEHFTLIKPASSILKQANRMSDKEDKEAIVRQLYGLDSSDPNVTFSLCCGTRSFPAVRIYTAEGIAAELEKSKLEYLQASIVVTSTKRIALPGLLLRNMHDFAKDMNSIVEWVYHQLPTSGSLRKSMVDCFRTLNTAKVSTIVDKTPYDSEFQYRLSI
ncbi:hypothetical protein LOK49_LG15G01660 [Camellia lanceoleosa]|uniref:Uncharacterized protein n=1 Tax=Camellia lanceoleosa TaxID=1840588 RepID=A0ACC0F1Y6_9ERIC|nr:hypothetical protein LOK49_LG15G01660 [Camellia lanceoleosa]